MDSTTTTAAAATSAFPAKAVADCLRHELAAAVKAVASLQGNPVSGTPGNASSLGVEVDSLTVVEILCALDDILPFEVDQSVVRPGGYASIESAVENVVKVVEKKWQTWQQKEGKHEQGG